MAESLDWFGLISLMLGDPTAVLFVYAEKSAAGKGQHVGSTSRIAYYLEGGGVRRADQATR